MKKIDFLGFNNKEKLQDYCYWTPPITEEVTQSSPDSFPPLFYMGKTSDDCSFQIYQDFGGGKTILTNYIIFESSNSQLYGYEYPNTTQPPDVTINLETYFTPGFRDINTIAVGGANMDKLLLGGYSTTLRSYIVLVTLDGNFTELASVVDPTDTGGPEEIFTVQWDKASQRWYCTPNNGVANPTMFYYDENLTTRGALLEDPSTLPSWSSIVAGQLLKNVPYKGFSFTNSGKLFMPMRGQNAAIPLPYYLFEFDKNDFSVLNTINIIGDGSSLLSWDKLGSEMVYNSINITIYNSRLDLIIMPISTRYTDPQDNSDYWVTVMTYNPTTGDATISNDIKLTDGARVYFLVYDEPSQKLLLNCQDTYMYEYDFDTNTITTSESIITKVAGSPSQYLYGMAKDDINRTLTGYYNSLA